jgi:nucleoside-diphosphate-sugar epimerase
MKVFVAGASGAVGRRMIPRLLAAGDAVVAMTRGRAKAESRERAGADAVVCDVFDRPSLTAAVRSASPAAIIHQQTDLPAAMNPRRLKTIYQGNNRVRREGTANLIAAGREAGVSRFVVQGMGTRYRPDDPGVQRGPAVEGDALWTDAPEPIGEAVRTVAEMEAAVLRDEAVAVVLRYGAFYGTGTWYGADGRRPTGAQAAAFNRGVRPRCDLLHPHRRRGVGRRRRARCADIRRLQYGGQ